MARFCLVAAAILWLPMTLHCELESIPGFDFLACHSESDSREAKSHCDDNCCSVERAAYKTELVRQTIPLPDLLPVFSLFVLPAIDTLTTKSGVEISAARPDLPKRWQFVFRTASPPRAPSFAS